MSPAHNSANRITTCHSHGSRQAAVKVFYTRCVCLPLKSAMIHAYVALVLILGYPEARERSRIQYLVNAMNTYSKYLLHRTYSHTHTMGTSTTICVEWSTPFSPCLPPRKLTSGVPFGSKVGYGISYWW